MNEERIEEINEEITQIKLENAALSASLQESALLHAEVAEGPNVKYKRQDIAAIAQSLNANRRRLGILRKELNQLTGFSSVSSSSVAFFVR